MKRISIIFGTRPEGVKLCPLVLAMCGHPDSTPHTCVTDYHFAPTDQAKRNLRLIGTDASAIVENVSMLLNDPGAYHSMARAVNPYGDGLACTRIITALERSIPGILCPA